MMISGLGTSSANVADTLIPKNAPSSTGNDSISLTSDTINSVLNGMRTYGDSSNAYFLFSKLNAGILYAGDLTDVQSAIDTYTNSLPSSNVSESSYTAPSAKFLKDLDTLKSAANSGNLADTESALAQAKLDAPDDVSGGMGTAAAKGDAAGETSLLLETRSNIAGSLVTQGYTPGGAQAEANAIVINGFFVGKDTKSDPLSVQTRDDQIRDLARSVANKTPSTQSGSIPTSSDPMFKIIESLLESSSAYARTQTLAELDSVYGDNGSGATSSVTSYG